MTIRLAAFALLLTGLFLAINRPAYRAFFAEDDLDNLANAYQVPGTEILRTLASPRVTGGDEFRATGYAYYYAMVRMAGLRYAPYIATIHAIHLFNVLLVFLLARALGAEILGACAAALFYVFHASGFDVYWKVMYVFDLLCATFALAAMLAYVRGRVLWALLFFWLSLRAKEVVIFFPVVLAAYEMQLGERRWKRLIPFFAISAVVGLFALVDNRGLDNDYAFRFTWAALAKTSVYYAEKLALAPMAGFAVVLVPLVLMVKQSKTRAEACATFGVVAFLLLLMPMLFLPGRLFAAYLYAPMIGLALAISTVRRPAWLAIFFLLWIPWNYSQFRVDRSQALDLSYERRAWFEPVAEFFRAHPETDTVLWDGTPPSVPEHYITGAARLLSRAPNVRVAWIHRAADEAQRKNLVALVWDPERRQLHVLGRQPDAAYVRTNETAPPWQLIEGWEGNQGAFRWTKPRARIRLQRPANAKALEIAVNVYAFDAQRPGKMDVALDGNPLGSIALVKSEPTTFRLPLPAGMEGPSIVEMRVSPPFFDPNGSGDLGQPITAIGFVTK